MSILPKKCRVTQEYESPYPNPIEFFKGEHVEIGDEFTDDPDWKNWVWCKGKTNQAWVPIQYLTIKEGKGIFNRNYNALELSVKIGEELIVYEEINGFGMAEKADGTEGWVPLKNLMEENKQGKNQE